MALVNARQGLILVTNSGEARLFSRSGEHDPLRPLSTLHPREDARSGDTLHKRHMAFAHQLSERIDQAINDGACDELVIAASCPFLGELRSALSTKARDRLRAEIDLDLTLFGLTELEHRLEEQMRALREHAR